MKKFPKKGELHVEALKLNLEILAYMSGTAKTEINTSFFRRMR